MLKYALLGFLNYQPMTGYELEHFLSVSTSNFWYASLSQIYMTLKKLEQGELVTSQVEPQEGRPDRRVYTITDKGRADLQGWLAQPLLELDPGKDTLLLKLFFARPIGKESILTQLRLHLDLHRRKLEHYQHDLPHEGADMVREHPELMTDAILWRATLRFGELYEAMYIQWLQETITTVEEQLPD